MNGRRTETKSVQRPSRVQRPNTKTRGYPWESEGLLRVIVTSASLVISLALVLVLREVTLMPRDRVLPLSIRTR